MLTRRGIDRRTLADNVAGFYTSYALGQLFFWLVGAALTALAVSIAVHNSPTKDNFYYEPPHRRNAREPTAGRELKPAGRESDDSSRAIASRSCSVDDQHDELLGLSLIHI